VASAFLFVFHVALTALSFSRIHFFYSLVALVADLTSHVLSGSMTHGSDEKSLFSLIRPSRGRGGWKGDGGDSDISKLACWKYCVSYDNLVKHINP